MNYLQPVFRLGALAFLLISGVVAQGQTITTITNTTSGHGLNGLAWGGMVGNQVTIYGSGFTTVSSVTFGGISALPGQFGATESTKIVATIPPGAISGSVVVTFTGGVTRSSPQPFTIIPTGPYVRSFSPVAGNSNTSVLIKGALLQGATAVRFNGVNARSAFYGPNANEITALPPVGVTTGPISVISNSFTHTTSNFFAEPILTGFSPSFGRTGTNVVITGTNLAGATEVWFNGLSSSFLVNHSGQITATVPANAVVGKITVFGPGGSVQSSSNFVVRPTIFSFTPNVGRPGTNVTIIGANLNEGTPVVRFGTHIASVSGVTFGQLTAIVPNAAITSLISVTTTNGSHTNDAFFYLPPRITGFTPSNSLPVSQITITGTNFTGASLVQFNGTTALFTVTNNNTIGATVPFGFTTGPISITTPAGATNTSSLASSNFFAVPQISGFTPSHGLPGTNVTLFGSSFLGASAVRFQAGGGSTTNGVIVPPVLNGQITVRVPTNAVTGSLTVVAPAGSDTSAGTFFLDYPDLVVSANDSPDPVTVGNNLTYSIQIQNFSSFAGVVTLTNVLPLGTTFISSSAGTNTVATNIITANLGTLAAGATTNVTIIARPNNPGVVITNLATAASGPLAFSAITTTYVEPLPLLSVGFYAPGEILLSWPTALSNYTLQYRSSLDPNVPWVNSLIAPAVSGGSNLISEPHTGTAKFYRLKR